MLTILLAVSATLLTSSLVGWWLVRRAWFVVRIYSRGWVWVKAKTLHGTVVEGWCPITTVRSLGNIGMVDQPFIRVKSKEAVVHLTPTELDSLNEITGLLKVSLRSIGNVI